MTTKIKNFIITFVAGLFLLSFLIWSIFLPDKALSTGERRPLNQFPETNAQTVLDGSFMADFEGYTLDQFPLRDGWRTIKALTSRYLFGQLDNNDIYFKNGHLAKIEYPENPSSVTHAVDRFKFVYDKYLKDGESNLFVSVIPDKNYFLSDDGGHPALDYEKFINGYVKEMDFAEYIDILPLLEVDDYYDTDTHWRQENIVDVAKYLSEKMGNPHSAVYTKKEADTDFFGVYAGQSALPLKAEKLYYLTNETLDSCTVYDFEAAVDGKNDPYISVYDFEKLDSSDPYEFFLSGSKSLLTIENPNVATDKELILFRDSFGSSIAPLFAENYAKVTLVDIRYISPVLLDRYIEFDGQDVLFLYSTSILNNSETIK